MTENNHNHSAPAYLTPKKVASELGISLTAVYALIQSGDLRALNVAPSSGQGSKRSYRIGRQWLNEFVARRTMTPASRNEGAVALRRRRRRRQDEPAVKDYLA